MQLPPGPAMLIRAEDHNTAGAAVFTTAAHLLHSPLADESYGCSVHPGAGTKARQPLALANIAAASFAGASATYR